MVSLCRAPTLQQREAMPSHIEQPRLTFLGAAGTVTGSKHLVEAGGRRLLLDCGLFQGPKPLRQRNSETPPFDPATLDAIVLSHAHLDHSGWLPFLVNRGFSGVVHCTPGTADLVAVVLADAAHLQEEDAARAARHGYDAPEPLYTLEDAEKAVRLLRRHAYGESFEVAPGMRVRLRRAGHILGSATIEVQLDGPSQTTLAYSGDLGRWNRPILRDPELVPEADVLLVESTYGDRLHSGDPEAALTRIIRRVADGRGTIVVPAFAIGRTQELIWTIRKLENAGAVPSLPVYVDTPMGIDVSELYCRHPEDHDLDMKLLMDQHRCPLCCRKYNLVRTAPESKALNDRPGPMIIIAGSGMATGGRVIHHLAHRLPEPRTVVLLVGYQAVGTRGRALQEGAPEIWLHGKPVPVRAQVETIDGLSAHADQAEILRWLSGFARPPRKTWLVHGEELPARSLAAAIENRLGWNVEVAQNAATVSLAHD